MKQADAKNAKRRAGLQSLAAFVVSLLLVAAVAGFGSRFTPGPWYREIAKPSWTPPGWLFGPVWTLLYLLMAAAAWQVWRRRGIGGARAALAVYLVQLVLNALWSWIFFGLHLIGPALVDLAVLWVLIVATCVLFFRASRIAGVLLLPYIAWVGFAGALNLALWILNRGSQA